MYMIFLNYPVTYKMIEKNIKRELKTLIVTYPWLSPLEGRIKRKIQFK